MFKEEIIIEISPATRNENETVNGGVMFEHNAVQLIFKLDAAYADIAYRYYLTFDSVLGGKARTVYLVPDASGSQIHFPIPREMTGMLCAACWFHIVRVTENGETEQVIQPKQFTLQFTPAEDVDKELCENADFTINYLLQMIENGTFKGDKGDKGDSYVLTETDKSDIAAGIRTEYFGTPFAAEASGTGTFTFPNTTGGAVLSLVVQGKTVTEKANPDEFVSDENRQTVTPLREVTITANGDAKTVALPDLHRLNDEVFDRVDLISGVVTRRVGVYALTGTEKINGNNVILPENPYLLQVYIAAEPFMKIAVGTVGLCTHYENVHRWIAESTGVDAAIKAGEPYIGIHFGQNNTCQYIYSTMDKPALSAYWKQQYEQGTPVTLYYPLAEPITEQIKPIAIPQTAGETVLSLEPQDIRAQIRCALDAGRCLSAVEKRLALLEERGDV